MLPAASVAVYVIVYVPIVLGSTVPDEVTVISTPWSRAVAPASVYVEPNSTVAGLSPSIFITGAKVSGAGVRAVISSSSSSVILDINAAAPSASNTFCIISNSEPIEDILFEISFSLSGLCVASCSSSSASSSAFKSLARSANWTADILFNLCSISNGVSLYVLELTTNETDKIKAQ